MSTLNYNPKITAAKAATTGGGVLGIGAVLTWLLSLARDQWGLPWDATVDAQLVVALTGILAGLWKGFQNWRKNA